MFTSKQQSLNDLTPPVQNHKKAYTLYFKWGEFAVNKEYGRETITEGDQDGEKG